MKSVTASSAKQNFGALLAACTSQPVAIVRHKKVEAIVISPALFAHLDPLAQRKMARLHQTVVEKDRLIRHQSIALQLLCLPKREALQIVERARSVVQRWSQEDLCSVDYISRWKEILQKPLGEISRSIVSDNDGWGTALRQNSPLVGVKS